MDDTTQARVRWFHLTPSRVVIALLAVEALLFLSQWFRWLAWHKGYALLTCVAAVGVAMFFMLVWFGVALVFRRRFQFSLRSLLVLVVVVAVPCSWLAVEMKKAKEQGEAVRAVRDLHGSVHYDYESEDPFGTSWPPPGPVWLRNLVGHDVLSDVNWVILEGTNVTDADLYQLNGLPLLRVLNLKGTKVTDAGLEHLKELRQLRVLTLDSTKVTNAGLECVEGLTELRNLSLDETDVTDAGLKHLRRLTQLEVLSLGEIRITDQGVKNLQAALPRCSICYGPRKVYASGTDATDCELADLERVRDVQMLDLSDSKVTDAGIEHLKGLVELEWLDLRNTKVTDAALKNLKGLPQLKLLRLAGTNVTTEGVAKLQQALPNCKITR